jgi:ADP-ribose pyrophosphatase YjhB (NUDIX family)
VSFSLRTPQGEDRDRRVCDTCGFIDYVNPRIVTGVVAVEGDRILLCRRAIEPRSGFWTLPAGFLETGETLEDGARREAREEAGAELELGAMLAVYSVPRISQIQIFFKAILLNTPSAGPESLEVGLFDWDDIPWNALAFPSVTWALEHWRATRSEQVFAPFSTPPDAERMARGP